MATKKKMLQAAAGNATGGAGLDITEVFSTYLYEGNSGTLSVNNGIDFSGEGGLVWIKNREAAFNHLLIDTARGGNKYLYADNAAAQGSFSSAEQFTLSSTGFSSTAADFNWNNSNYDYASWSFRKAPKFFTCVTYTGDGVAGRTISHDLGTTVGMLVVKSISHATDFKVQHRSVGATIAMELNNTRAATDVDVAFWNDTPPTDTHFTVGSNSGVNLSGRTYVAYLFAHNDGDGGFGPDGDQDIIKCGTYEGNSGTQEIDLGFEPQWVMIKNIESRAYQASLDWNIFDNMRLWANRTSGDNDVLIANGTDAETPLARCFPTANGFAFYNDGAYSLNFSGDTYIYMAIRRGPLAQPESATEVFAIDTANGTSPSPPHFNSGFPVDFEFNRDVASAADWYAGSRLTGSQFLRTNTTDAQQGDNSLLFDYQNGFYNASYTFNTAYSWMWKRAPGFFDAVAYTGTGSARTVSHNLGVAPELIVTKRRESSMSWAVGVPSISSGQGYLKLQSSDALDIPFYTVWSNITASSYNVGADGITNASGATYISYLFATVPGVSKVGSYTGNGTSQTIDCGFTSGARFVLIKRTDSADDWIVVDTVRGIVSGNDPYLALNTTDPQGTSQDYVDPHSSGFIVTGENPVGASGGSYIFYAIA